MHLVRLACELPEQAGRSLSQWDSAELARQLVIDEVVVRQRSGPFLEHAWDVLRTVPAGAPITYTEYAAKAGRPAAVRAAASACAKNATALFVPCHRVLGTDGTMRGFRWGTDVKQALLAHEARH